MLNITFEQLDGHGSWIIETPRTLSNDEALNITFRAMPSQVVMGQYVQITDAEGIRIGMVKRAEYFERSWGPAYVVVGIDLR